MLATGGTLSAAIEFLFARGAEDVTALLSPGRPGGPGPPRVGLPATRAAPIKVVTAGLDERLNELGYILPGLGDAGDRLYGVV